MTGRYAQQSDGLGAGVPPPVSHREIRGMLCFLAAALAIRLSGINSASIWFDEAISRYRASVSLADYFTYMSSYTGTNLWELILRPFAAGSVWLLRFLP